MSTLSGQRVLHHYRYILGFNADLVQYVALLLRPAIYYVSLD